jgi:glycosyltransferase involved in cell wall biosynthesis
MNSKAMDTPYRVLFCCTGVGIFNRGIESFFREAYDGLRSASGARTWLLKGAGESGNDEFRVPCVPRTSGVAVPLGRAIRRNPYVVEQLTSFPFVAAKIRQLRPHIVFYSDSNLGYQLFRWRRLIDVPFRLLFSNGGPCFPPFDRTDFVQQVVPHYYDQAIAAGEDAGRHFLVPYGIGLCEQPSPGAHGKTSARRRLSLPEDHTIVLSVGYISRTHKRMHYLVEELARLPQPRPFLQMLGAMDESSDEIVALARELLGPDGFSARSVPYEQVFDYYRSADLFVLASLQEGFGRVYLEAMMHGLPVIAHEHPVMRYVLGEFGVFGDLSKQGELTALVAQELAKPGDHAQMTQRWMCVRDRFSWPALASKYVEMFASAAQIAAA